MLLTVPERRQAIADLRLAGTRRGAIVQIVAFQALCLGSSRRSSVSRSATACRSGSSISRPAISPRPSRCPAARSSGSGRSLLAGLGGLAATFLASAVPLLDLRRGRARDAVYREAGMPGNALGARAQRLLFGAALAVLAAATLAVRAGAVGRDPRRRDARAGDRARGAAGASPSCFAWRA